MGVFEVKKLMLFVLVGLVVMSMFMSCAYASVYKKENLIVFDREKVAGGDGILYGLYSFTRDMPPMESPVREVSWLTLKPGDSVGVHKHEVNEDIYIFISGIGVYTDNEGVEHEVGPGDITLARLGTSHAIANKGTEDLVFIGIIAGKTP